MVLAVDAVVVTYESADLIDRCLLSLLSLPWLASTTVVDHSRTADDVSRRHAGVSFIHNPANPGFGSGQNQGAACGSAPWLLFVNPDAELRTDAIAAGIAGLHEDPVVVAAQGVILSDGRAERSAGRALTPLHLAGRLVRVRRLLALRIVQRAARRSAALRDHVDRVPDAPRQVEWLAATVLAVRREAFESVGGFDSRYFLYGEDLDLCARLRHAGGQMVSLPEVWADHFGGASSSTGWDRELAWWEGTLRYGATWWSPPAWLAGWILGSLRALGLGARRPRRGREALKRLVVAPVRHRRRTQPASVTPRGR